MIRIINKCAFSDKGIRENNEDFILLDGDLSSSGRVFVLCDGMGGHGHGEVASQTVAIAVYNFLNELDDKEFTEGDLQQALNSASLQLNSADIFDDQKRMGTTLVVVAINKMNVLIGHVGDSRCYQFDKDGIKKYRSKDHSKVAEAVEAEILTEEEAYNSNYKNLLTRCVIAGKGDVSIDVDTLFIEDGDRLMLCSDGVVDAMRDETIQAFLMNRPLEDALELIKQECEAKSKDNYSAILIALSQDEVNKPQSEIDHFGQDKSGEVNSHTEIRGDKFCSLCGTRNTTTAQFCRQCGSPLQIPQKEKESYVKFAMKWGTKNAKALAIGFATGLVSGFGLAKLYPTDATEINSFSEQTSIDTDSTKVLHGGTQTKHLGNIPTTK